MFLLFEMKTYNSMSFFYRQYNHSLQSRIRCYIIADAESNPSQVRCNVIPVGYSCSDVSYILAMPTLHPTALAEPEASIALTA